MRQWITSVVERITKFAKGRPVSQPQRQARLSFDRLEQREMMSVSPLGVSVQPSITNVVINQDLPALFKAAGQPAAQDMKGGFKPTI